MGVHKKRGVKIAAAIVLILLAAFLLLIGVLTVTEYRPEDVEQAEITGDATKTLSQGDTFTVLTWNIGYGALSETADFFMDGGEHVRSSSREQVTENVSSIAAELRELDADIMYLQEVDRSSKRSYYVDELEYATRALTDYESTFATNYKVLYVPYPLPTIGKVDCGIATLSSYPLSDSERVSLPCPFTYPIRLCNLKRCLLVDRIPVEGTDHELVLVNLHLEAYDDGEGKEAQTKQLQTLLQEEAQKGNYVIAGGDFNQSFSNYDNSAYPIINEDMWVPGEVDVEAFGEEFQFVTDNTTPSCRSLDRPLAGNDSSPESFQYYMIDGFIVSSNVKIHSVETKDLGFEHADHNPIVMEVLIE